MGGWFTLLEDASADDAVLLDALLRLQPSEEPLGAELPAGWFARLSLREPDAIRLTATGDQDVTLAGLFDRRARSLALVGDGRVRVWGGDAALRRLLAQLPDLRDHPLDLHHLHIEAVPTPAGRGGPGATSIPPGSLTLARPSFDLVVTAVDPGG
jgi:hypothetical protein